MAAYSMPFHTRDVLGSYPSAQLAAVDRDTQIFRYGQIFQNTSNPNRRLVAARTLAGISPGYQEARIESLAGDNFNTKAFQDEQREQMALQKKYIQDRTEYMEQKTANRLLRGSLVQALRQGGRSTGDRTPFADLDLDENFDISGGVSRASSGQSGVSSPSQSGRFFQSMDPEALRAAIEAGEGGLTQSFWRGEGPSSVSSQSIGEGSESSWLSQEYGLGVEPINLNIDPQRLQRIQATRAASSEERARQEVVGSLVGEMVSDVAGYEARQQEYERQSRLMNLYYQTPLEIENPRDMNEADLRLLARTVEAQRRRGFFGRAEMAAEETFMEQPLEIESAEMGMEPGGRSLQEMLGTVDEFGERGSLALASMGGGAARPRGRPKGFKESEETKARRKETKELRRMAGAASMRPGGELNVFEAMNDPSWPPEYRAGFARLAAGLRRPEEREAEERRQREQEAQFARSRGVRGMARRLGFLNPQNDPGVEEQIKSFSLFD